MTDLAIKCIELLKDPQNSYTDISKVLYMDASYVGKINRKYNVRNTIIYKPSKTRRSVVSKLIEKYSDEIKIDKEFLTIKEMCKKYDCSKNSIIKIYKELNLS